MKAVIMAGGEGSRLRPLTCDLPKPMARLCGRPVLEYILELLENNGFTNAAITLRYLPDRITEHFPDERFGNVALDFVVEDKPLGTAGSVKNACQDDSEVLVISGDAMCDFDLANALAAHRQKGADVTILAKRVEDPREYGLIDADEEGRIRAFIEKPAFSQAVSDLANTGLYILSKRALDLIPDDEPFDFAKNLFPSMLEKGMFLLCKEDEGYWCDIGDLESYVRCQHDMLLGRVKCRLVGERDQDGNVFVQARPHGCEIVPPVYIGRNVYVEEGVRLENGTVLDDGVKVGRGARVTGSVVLQNAQIFSRSSLTNSLICAGGVVKSGAMLFEGSTVGAGAVVGARAIVNAGVKVWNRKVIPEASIVTEHVKTGSGARSFFADEGIVGQIGVELTPEFCARLGSAVGTLHPRERIGIGGSQHHSARVLKDALAAGIQSTGAGVIDFGENFQTQFEFSLNFCSLPLGVYIKGDRRAWMRVMSKGGLPATRDIERGIEGILARGEFIRAPYDQMGERVQMPGMGVLYQSQLIRCAVKGLDGCQGQVRSNNLLVRDMLSDTLYRLGCDTTKGPRMEVSSQGDKLRIFDSELGWISHHRIFAWCAMAQLEKGDIAVPFDAPQVLDEYAKETGYRVLRYFACPADQSDSEARKLARKQMWSRDALMQAIILQKMLRYYGGLDALSKAYPAFDVQTRTMETQGSPAGLLRRIGNRPSGQITEGVLVQNKKGIVLVRPLKRGTGLRILAEAVNSETAAELCEDIEKLLEKARGN